MSQPFTESELPLLLEAAKIQARVRELAAEISRDYQDSTLHLVGVLKGAWIFLADLIRYLSVPCTVDFLAIQSYGANAVSSGEVKITKDLDLGIEGRDVLIVEDILDTGRTCHYLLDVLSARSPRSLKLVTLLDKPAHRIVPVRADYSGFEIPDVFVVGYGLDFDQRYRHLPDVHYIPHAGVPKAAWSAVG